MAHGDRRTGRKRGSRTHGYGNAQKHRGAGSRGGRGMAGSKKHKWQRISKNEPGRFGRKGFKRPGSSKLNAVNVGQLSEDILRYVESGIAKESKGAYDVDLAAAGIDKLLGAGAVDKRLNIKVGGCSPKARGKIEAAGGSVETTSEGEAVEEPSSGEADES